MTFETATPRPRRRLVVFTACLAALLLLAAALWLPVWTMKLEAPQYPQGLVLQAYGDRIEGDLREINIINHYIGMEKIDAQPAPEMALFQPAIWGLMLLVLVAPLHRRLSGLAILATAAMPMAILVDLQIWLHHFGQNLDPTAPLRADPFTPLVLGISKIGNFTSTGMVGVGFFCMLGALLCLVVIRRVQGRQPASVTSSSEVGPAAARKALPAVSVSLLCLGFALTGAAAGADLQERLDAAPPGSTVTVDGGIHPGPVIVRGPLEVVGLNGPILDGGGHGSVVTLAGEGIVFRGFTVRNSGRQVTEEAAGISVTGDRHRIEDNRIEDVYFGIHVEDGAGHEIVGNDLAPGQDRGARPGHAVSLWHVTDTRVVRNRIRDARDGVYLSFVDGVEVEGNEISDCRYAVHSMYSENAVVRGNHFHHNLLGAALMYSDSLTLTGNRIEDQRLGATPYGVLLKDIEDLDLAGNRLVRNRVGIYAEGVAQQPESRARIEGNWIAGQETGLLLQKNVRVTVVGNLLVDNLADVRAKGGELSKTNRWSEDGRGNYWSAYRGFDREGDGIGDLAHRVEGVMEELLRKSPGVQAFLYTPAHLTLQAASRMFPLYRPEPLLVDDAPLLEPPPIPEVSR